ncbi:MAG: hypothetical protein Q8R47_04700 [Nanoarchaeota archaeon]|nr:hypothetical protein [Nanoarchaeota archaeon]
MKLSRLEEALPKCWAKETSSDPENWNHDNPAWGQCAVTALIVNDYLGGEIVWAEAKLPDGRGISHYFNNLDEKEIDLTRRQFPEGTIIPAGVEKRKQYPTTRDYVLSFPVTQQRYHILSQKVEECLNNNP